MIDDILQDITYVYSELPLDSYINGFEAAYKDYTFHIPSI